MISEEELDAGASGLKGDREAGRDKEEEEEGVEPRARQIEQREDTEEEDVEREDKEEEGSMGRRMEERGDKARWSRETRRRRTRGWRGGCRERTRRRSCLLYTSPSPRDRG
eukprot:942307-Rhodomonas_salina.2